MADLLNFVNTLAYQIANLFVIYIAIGVVVFVIGYYALFDPRATTAGRLVFRFFLSLVGIIGLVFIGTYIDPIDDHSWTTLPSGVEPWRPLLRLIVYGYVAYTITSLAVLLWLRKYRPHKIKSAPDKELVKVRHDTAELPITKPKTQPLSMKGPKGSVGNSGESTV